jgi:hypothetical protein
MMREYSKKFMGAIVYRKDGVNLIKGLSDEYLHDIVIPIRLLKGDIDKEYYEKKIIKKYKKHKLIEILLKESDKLRIYYIDSKDNIKSKKILKGHYVMVCNMKKRESIILDLRFDKSWFLKKNKEEEEDECMYVKTLINQSRRMKMRKVMIRDKENIVINNKIKNFNKIYKKKYGKTWYMEKLNFNKKREKYVKREGICKIRIIRQEEIK